MDEEKKLLQGRDIEAWNTISRINSELTNLNRELHRKSNQLEKLTHELNREIVRRIESEEELKSAKTRYQALMEQSSEALALVDMESREAVEVNRRFTELFGYSLPEDAPLYVSKYVADSQSISKQYATMTQERYFPTEALTIRHKNGSLVHVERAGTVVSLGGKVYLLASSRDMSAERKRQSDLVHDVELACRVQRELLPAVLESPFVNIRTVYHPSNLVSGDSYYLQWQMDGKVLRGFLIDVSGHGVATALQTASLNVLLREIAESKLPLLEQMTQLNERVSRYFTEDSYAAVFGFELDISASELRYVGAGITQFHANGRKIETPGNYVGMFKNAEFEAGSIPVSEGDTFHFLTDGFTDALAQPENAGFWSTDGKDFDTDVAALKKLAESGRLRDDATGICLKI